MCSIRKKDGSVFKIPSNVLFLSENLSRLHSSLSCFHLIEDHLSPKKWKCIESSGLLNDIFPENVHWIEDEKRFNQVKHLLKEKVSNWKLSLDITQLNQSKSEIFIMDHIIKNFNTIFQPAIFQFKCIKLEAMTQIEHFFRLCEEYEHKYQLSHTMFDYLPCRFKEMNSERKINLKKLFKKEHIVFCEFMDNCLKQDKKCDKLMKLAVAAQRLEIKVLCDLSGVYAANYINESSKPEIIKSFKVPFRYLQSIEEKMTKM
jgi:hypothetical protein